MEEPAAAAAINNSSHKQTLTVAATGMETVFSVDDFCNTDDLLQLIDDANNLNEQNWYENDLQLAAELGKTLLERNQELEFALRQQQALVEDQALEIEYLSKQTTALKEVGESRLKVYEQLEINLQELEKSHQKLQHESLNDKKKIKNLCSSLSELEQRCEQLQKSNEELSSAKWREKEEARGGAGEKENEVSGLKKQLEELRNNMRRDEKLKQQLDVELSCLLQENEQLREQLVALKQRELLMAALPLQLNHLEDEFKLCCRCRQRRHRAEASTETELEEVEDEATSQQLGKCAVVKFINGATAYGNRDSLRQAGGTEEESDSYKKWSLLTELDAQYRVLIDKYERMVNARQQLEADDMSPARWHPTTIEESSSLSSGFSEGEESVVHRGVQTEAPEQMPRGCRGAVAAARNKQSFDGYFQRVPEYKTIFQEIFAVLKKSISYDETSFVDSFPLLSSSCSVGTLCSAAGPSVDGGRRLSYADVVMSGARRRQWAPKLSKTQLN